MSRRRAGTVAALGLAQTLAWGSSFYLPAMLATAMARDLAIAPATVFAAFSLALVVSALVGPAAGRLIDRQGGRSVLLASNALFASGLVVLGLATGPWTLLAAWALLGLAMGCGLYEAAFAVLVRLHGQDARHAITGITLIAGFASTVGWPLMALLEAQFGWRGACFGWAGLHLFLGMPLNASLPKAPGAEPGSSDPPTEPGVAKPEVAPAPSSPSATARPVLSAVLLAFVFAVTAFIATAMASHLPRLLQASGATLAAAVAVGALIGPAQVAARLLEFGLLRRLHPLLSARLAALGHPVGAGVLLLVGAPAAVLFALLHGAGNGILTIARGTLPLALFGPQGYGARQGWLMMPARMASAAAPWLFGLALDHWGAPALGLCAALGGAAFVALMGVPRPQARAGDTKGPGGAAG